MTLFHTCWETLHRYGGWVRMKVNEIRTVVGEGLIGHCVSPQPWREIDAHACMGRTDGRRAKRVVRPIRTAA